MLNIVIEVKAPEIVDALKTLTGALAGVELITQPAPAQPAPQPAPAPAPAQPAPQPAPAPAPQPAPAQPAPAQPAPQPTPPPASVPVAPAPQYTIEQLGVAAGPLVDAGKGPELTAWLQSKGVQALTQLDSSLYGEFATFLRSSGARI
jgi:hypothetical protein